MTEPKRPDLEGIATWYIVHSDTKSLHATQAAKYALRLEQERDALKTALGFYANPDQWSEYVCDSTTGACEHFDWDGDLDIDRGYEIAQRALEGRTVAITMYGAGVQIVEFTTEAGMDGVQAAETC